MNRSQLLNTLPVSQNDFIVEVGAGHIPFGGTKLILDKYPFDNSERWDDIRNVAPIIKADAQKIPLRDQSCDLLFSSHVIEHVDEPDKFVQEIKRCSRYAYLEFPTFTRELMFAWSFHKWVVDIEEGLLIFYKNDIPQMFRDFFHKNYDLVFHIWCEQRFEELNTPVYIESSNLSWEYSERTAFEHVLAHSPIGDEKMNLAVRDRKPYTSRQLLMMALYGLIPDKLIKTKNDFLRRRNSSQKFPLSDEIFERLICQRCSSSNLLRECDTILCNSCNARYKKEEGIFDFDISPAIMTPW